MHRQTGVVTTNIVEYGFYTNSEDAARLQANWKKYAEAVVKAYCEFVNHKYVEPKGESVVSQPTHTQAATVILNGKELEWCNDGACMCGSRSLWSKSCMGFSN